ncbi:YciI family protein [Deinococcus sp.]|uniref:YciI family protein n=1 Tax=Deinococcus sp. TaxID=47478 RepID=UPI0025C44E79|nr:YciI family protein [Deinococcus sp.]
MTHTLTLWIIESTYLKSGDELAAVTPLHRAWLDQHYISGVFLTSGRKADGSGGVIVAQAGSEQQLRDIFRDDPFVKQGCSEYRYTAFTPVKRGRMLDLEGVPLVE